MQRASILARPGWTVVALLACGLVAAWFLGLDPRDLFPRAGGRQVAREFLSAALRPAFDYQDGLVPDTAPSFFTGLLLALSRTVVFAAAAMSLALVWGLGLGVLASEAFWDRSSRRTSRFILAAARLTAVGLRSIHELLWAVLFLAAFGFSPVTGVLAIALPYAGVLAKVTSELIDEADRKGRDHLHLAGVSGTSAFLFGLLPRALPDIGAYSFYRLECALRSSAVLGFFGFPTIGLAIAKAFENLHYNEVWTYLYALAALVLGLEAWSGRLRARLVT